mgnify:CR=1 FL=1
MENRQISGYSDLIAYRLNGILGQNDTYYIQKNREGKREVIVSDMDFRDILVKSKLPKVYAFAELSSRRKEILLSRIANLNKADYNIRVYDREGKLVESFIMDKITEDDADSAIRASYRSHSGEVNAIFEKQRVMAEKMF